MWDGMAGQHSVTLGLWLYVWVSSAVAASKETQTKHVKLSDCLQQFIKPEVLSRENTWYCNKCEEHVQATNSLSVWKLPEVLIIQLKRFEFQYVCVCYSTERR